MSMAQELFRPLASPARDGFEFFQHVCACGLGYGLDIIPSYSQIHRMRLYHELSEILQKLVDIDQISFWFPGELFGRVIFPLH